MNKLWTNNIESGKKQTKSYGIILVFNSNFTSRKSKEAKNDDTNYSRFIQ